MAAKSLGDFIETYKVEHGCNPGIIETWYAAIEFAEANKPSHNMRSRKNLLTLWKWFVGKFIRRVRSRWRPFVNRPCHRRQV